MYVRQYIRPDMTVSAIVHLSLVAIFMFSEMRPLHPVTEETIPVEVVVEEKKPASQPPAPATRATRRETSAQPQSPPQQLPQSQPQSQSAALTPAAPSSAPG